jgi:dTMP kinase
MKDKPKFWAIEGAGGAGKTTLTTYLADYLRSLGRKVSVTREPGGVPAAEDLRELIFSLKASDAISAEQQVVLFSAVRYLWIKRFVRPAMEEGFDVVTDRSFPSTAVYQVVEGASIENVDKITEIVMQGLRPDVLLYLDISAKTALIRRAQDNGDPFDRLGEGYFRKIVTGYRQLYDASWGKLNWQYIDAEQSVESVVKDMKVIVDKTLAPRGIKDIMHTNE